MAFSKELRHTSQVTHLPKHMLDFLRLASEVTLRNR